MVRRSRLHSCCRCFSTPRLLLAALFLLGVLAYAPTPSRAAAQPNVIASNITTTATVTLGTTFTLTVKISNTGTAPAPAFANRVWASLDNTINSSDNLLGAFTAPALAAGDSTTITLVIDTRRVGPNQDQELLPGTYYVGVELDVLNQVLNESSEANTFLATRLLNIIATTPRAIGGFAPMDHAHGSYVSRALQWTTVTGASRYDVYLARLKDTDQRFIRHNLISDLTTGTEKIYFAPLHTDIEYYYHNSYYYSGVLPSVQPPPAAYSNSRSVPYQVPSNYPYTGNDMLVPQSNSLSLYERIAEMPGDLDNPRFFAPRRLITFSTSTVSSGYGSTKYSNGSITAVCPVNINYLQRKDLNNVSDQIDYMTDVVLATYLDAGDDQTTIAQTVTGGSVVVMLNLPVTVSDILTTLTFITPRQSPEELRFLPMKLKSNRGIKGEAAAYVDGIKSMVVADFDNDGDYDIMVGGDLNSTGRDYYKVAVYQNSLRNNPQYMADGKTPYYSLTKLTTTTLGPNYMYQPTNLPTFKPNGIGSLSGIADLKDMMIGDFDKDRKMDVAAASFFGNGVYILHNTTTAPSSARTTATLGFATIGPLFANEAMSTTTFLGANSVCTTDINNDNRTDIVAAAYFQGTVIAYENTWVQYAPTDTTHKNPLPLVVSNFIPHLVTSNFPNVEKVTSFDMNGDGYQDIIVSSATNDRISWYENLGGTFKFVEHVITSRENRAGAVGITDMNGDLLPDVVSVSQYDRTISWYNDFPTLGSKNLVATNLIKPTFTPATLYDFATTYLWQVTAKASNAFTTTSKLLTFHTESTRVVVDPDPVNNIIEPTAGANMYAHIKNVGPQPVRDFSFSAVVDPLMDRPYNANNTPMYTFGSYSYARGYAPGATDTVYAGFDATHIPEGLYNLWIVSSFWVPEDRDGVMQDNIADGIPDGLDSSPLGNWPNAYYPLTDSTFGPEAFLGRKKLAVIYTPDMPKSPVPGDMATDVPTGTGFSWSMDHNYANYYDILMAKAAATAPTYTTTTVTNNVLGIQSFDLGDMTGDGKAEMVSGSVSGGVGVINWYKNRGDSRSFIKYPIVSNLTGPPLVQIADMDHDGARDVLAASASSSQLWWYKNMGGDPLAFSAPRSIATGLIGVNSIRAADLDGNGTMDVLAATSGNKKLCWFSGTSGINYVIDASNGPALCAIPADVNGDGHMDVIAAFWGSPNTVAWYENVGGNPAQFMRHQLSSTFKEPQWLAAGDLNGDGNLDIACLSASAGLTWFANGGGTAPTFTANTVTNATGLHTLAITDFNHDARLDLITASTLGNNLVYYANDGKKAPVFTPYTIRSFTPGSITGVGAADMDGDNFPEVAGASTAGLIAWFDYQTNFAFGSPLTLNGTSTSTFYRPSSPLDPAMGYQWMVKARRVIPLLGGGTLERATTSSVWSLYTGQSDLVVKTAGFAPAAIKQGDPVTFTVTVTNNGMSDASAQTTGIWLSPDSIITGGGNDIFLGWINFPAIPSKGSITRQLTVNTANVPFYFLDFLPHYFYVGLIADALGQNNSESNQDNNKLVLNGRLTVTRRNAAQTWGNYR